MNRQEFESLPIEKQVSFMNERSEKKLKDIATEIGIPASSLSQLFIKSGYTRKSGVYIKDVKEEPTENRTEEVVGIPNELNELLQHKDELIALLQKDQQEEKALDFTVLNQYKDDSGKIQWSNLSFQLPTDLHNQLDEYLEKRGYKKQFLLSLIIQQFLMKI